MKYTADNSQDIDLTTAPLAGIIESGRCYLNIPELFTIGGEDATKKRTFNAADGLYLVRAISRFDAGDKKAWYELCEMSRQFTWKEWWTRVFAVILYRRSKGWGDVDLRVKGHPYHPFAERVLKNMEAVFASYLTTNKGADVKTSREQLAAALAVVASVIVDLLCPEMTVGKVEDVTAPPVAGGIGKNDKLAKTAAAVKKEVVKTEAAEKAAEKRPETPKVTLDDIRMLIQKNLATNRAAIVEILGSVGAKSANTLKEEDYLKVHTALLLLGSAEEELI